MSPQNDRNRGDSEEEKEKPRSTRRWAETPRKRPVEDDEKRSPDEKPRKAGRRQDSDDWDDELDDDFDDLEDLDDEFEFEDPDLDDPDFDPDLDHDEEPLP